MTEGAVVEANLPGPVGDLVQNLRQGNHAQQLSALLRINLDSNPQHPQVYKAVADMVTGEIQTSLGSNAANVLGNHRQYNYASVLIDGLRSENVALVRGCLKGLSALGPDVASYEPSVIVALSDVLISGKRNVLGQAFSTIGDVAKNITQQQSDFFSSKASSYIANLSSGNLVPHRGAVECIGRIRPLSEHAIPLLSMYIQSDNPRHMDIVAGAVQVVHELAHDNVVADAKKALELQGELEALQKNLKKYDSLMIRDTLNETLVRLDIVSSFGGTFKLISELGS